MDPMRGINPEEAAAYKRLKSRIFTRVSRGKEGVMDVHVDGMKESLASALAQIATLTAERDDWQKSCAAYGNANMALIAERDTALAIIAELREALAQFKNEAGRKGT